MSWAEDFLNYGYDDEDFNKYRDIWRTKDGRILKIKDMELSHIKNCIKKFGKNNVPKLMLKRINNKY